MEINKEINSGRKESSRWKIRSLGNGQGREWRYEKLLNLH